MRRDRLHRILFAVVMFCASAAADQISEAQQGVYSDKEKEICHGKNSYSYALGGERYFVPYEAINGEVIAEGDIVIGQAADVLNGGANYTAPIVPDFVRGQPRRWENNLVPFVVDNSVTDSLTESSFNRPCRNGPAPQISGLESCSGQEIGKEKTTSNSLAVKKRSAPATALASKKGYPGRSMRRITSMWCRSMDAVHGAKSLTKSDTF